MGIPVLLTLHLYLSLLILECYAQAHTGQVRIYIPKRQVVPTVRNVRSHCVQVRIADAANGSAITATVSNGIRKIPAQKNLDPQATIEPAGSEFPDSVPDDEFIGDLRSFPRIHADPDEEHTASPIVVSPDLGPELARTLSTMTQGEANRLELFSRTKDTGFFEKGVFQKIIADSCIHFGIEGEPKVRAFFREFTYRDEGPQVLSHVVAVLERIAKVQPYSDMEAIHSLQNSLGLDLTEAQGMVVALNKQLLSGRLREVTKSWLKSNDNAFLATVGKSQKSERIWGEEPATGALLVQRKGSKPGGALASAQDADPEALINDLVEGVPEDVFRKSLFQSEQKKNVLGGLVEITTEVPAPPIGEREVFLRRNARRFTASQLRRIRESQALEGVGADIVDWISERSLNIERMRAWLATEKRRKNAEIALTSMEQTVSRQPVQGMFSRSQTLENYWTYWWENRINQGGGEGARSIIEHFVDLDPKRSQLVYHLYKGCEGSHTCQTSVQWEGKLEDALSFLRENPEYFTLDLFIHALDLYEPKPDTVSLRGFPGILDAFLAVARYHGCDRSQAARITTLLRSKFPRHLASLSEYLKPEKWTFSPKEGAEFIPPPTETSNAQRDAKNLKRYNEIRAKLDLPPVTVVPTEIKRVK